MSAWSNISSVYFIGIGGIGMSSLARYFNQSGKLVFGYDKTPSPLCAELEKEGIIINYKDEIETLEKDVDLVVYTPAIPKEHNQLTWYLNQGYTVKKRSAVLGLATKNKYCIAVAGSHGKTTVSTMIAHILHNTVGCTAFLGGIASNYDSNYLFSTSKYAVVEADEYDRSFLHLNPDLAVVTSIDSDHLDIYGSLENIEREFLEFINKIDPKGTLLFNETVIRLIPQIQDLRVLTYGEAEGVDYQLNKPRISHGIYHFSIDREKGKIEDLILNLGGRHNLWNATAAIAVCKEIGLHDEEIRSALLKFKGVKRRFDKHVDAKGIVYIDDYAHHPNEIKALLNSLKELFPEKHITAIFQPHLFSRTSDLADDFAEVLGIANEVVLLPIYPARELPIEGVSSELIGSNIKCTEVSYIERDKVLKYLNHKPVEIVVTIGAGDIDRIVPKITEFLRAKSEVGNG